MAPAMKTYSKPRTKTNMSVISKKKKQKVKIKLVEPTPTKISHDSLEVELDNTFDRLLKGEVYNNVHYKSQPKLNLTSDEDLSKASNTPKSPVMPVIEIPKKPKAYKRKIAGESKKPVRKKRKESPVKPPIKVLGPSDSSLDIELSVEKENIQKQVDDPMVELIKTCKERALVNKHLSAVKWNSHSTSTPLPGKVSNGPVDHSFMSPIRENNPMNTPKRKSSKASSKNINILRDTNAASIVEIIEKENTENGSSSIIEISSINEYDSKSISKPIVYNTRKRASKTRKKLSSVFSSENDDTNDTLESSNSKQESELSQTQNTSMNNSNEDEEIVNGLSLPLANMTDDIITNEKQENKILTLSCKESNYSINEKSESILEISKKNFVFMRKKPSNEKESNLCNNELSNSNLSRSLNKSLISYISNADMSNKLCTKQSTTCFENIEEEDSIANESEISEGNSNLISASMKKEISMWSPVVNLTRYNFDNYHSIKDLLSSINQSQSTSIKKSSLCNMISGSDFNLIPVVNITRSDFNLSQNNESSSIEESINYNEFKADELSNDESVNMNAVVNLTRNNFESIANNQYLSINGNVTTQEDKEEESVLVKQILSVNDCDKSLSYLNNFSIISVNSDKTYNNQTDFSCNESKFREESTNYNEISRFNELNEEESINSIAGKDLVVNLTKNDFDNIANNKSSMEESAITLKSNDDSNVIESSLLSNNSIAGKDLVVKLTRTKFDNIKNNKSSMEESAITLKSNDDSNVIESSLLSNNSIASKDLVINLTRRKFDNIKNNKSSMEESAITVKSNDDSNHIDIESSLLLNDYEKSVQPLNTLSSISINSDKTFYKQTRTVNNCKVKGNNLGTILEASSQGCDDSVIRYGQINKNINCNRRVQRRVTVNYDSSFNSCKENGSIITILSENTEGEVTNFNTSFAKPTIHLNPGKWRRSLLQYRKTLLEASNICSQSALCSCTQCKKKEPTTIDRSLCHKGTKRLSAKIVIDPKSFSDNKRLSILESYAQAKNNPLNQTIKTLDDTFHDLSLRGSNSSFSATNLNLLTAKDILWKRCGQKDLIPFSTLFTDAVLKGAKKIGEGVYGEVFSLSKPGGNISVIKIIPIEGDDLVNGERQKRYDEILSEVVVAQELSNLRRNRKYRTTGFSEIKRTVCIQGKYPMQLIRLWDEYDADNGSENVSPRMFKANQIYIVLEFGFAGKDLEAFVFNNAQQTYSVFRQCVCALAVAEATLEFEHRDLHWGNILIKAIDKNAMVNYNFDGNLIEVPSHGVEATIIDFTMSRVTCDGVCIYNDLAEDPELFTADGDYQFEIYRLMQNNVCNQWEKYSPYTNVLWMHYILDKLISAARYKYQHTKIHKDYIHKLKREFRGMLKYDSIESYVKDNFINATAASP